MRKILSFLLIFFYLIPAIGVSINAHWCGKKLSVVSVGSSHDDKCSCSKKMSKGCCSDATIAVKITDSQKATSQINFPSGIFTKQISSTVLLTFNFTDIQLKAFDFSRFHAPPFKSKQPVYLMNSVYRV